VKWQSPGNIEVISHNGVVGTDPQEQQYNAQETSDKQDKPIEPMINGPAAQFQHENNSNKTK
jgi:glutaminase